MPDLASLSRSALRPVLRQTVVVTMLQQRNLTPAGVLANDRDEALQIASIKSRPNDRDCETGPGSNVDHVTP